MGMETVELPQNLIPWKAEFVEKTNRLIRVVSRYLSKEDVEEVKRACVFGAFAHQEQFRSSGEPYIFHPIAVALILTEVEIDAASIVGAILHDVIEDTDIEYDEIKYHFGEDVANIVDGVTKLTQIRFRSKEEAKAENFRKMVLAMTKDLRVIMVKLADRLHNMRTLGALPAYKKRRIARETLEIYAPIASRLGMYVLQVYLENLCFENLYPMRYEVLKNELEKKDVEQHDNLNKILESIDERLVRSNILSRLSTRRKHLWSIYQKMRVKGGLDYVYDIFAIRIIVRSVDDCYRVLGIVHQLYKPIIGGFKDYIAIPKINGYQSLHTVVFGANGLPVEVQIRTRDMHIVAEVGAAAHWRYKESYEGQSHAFQKTTKWLDVVTELQDITTSPEEFMETMKAELFPKEIYVFTPKGRIIELPRGATALDFAYAVHTDIGDTFEKALVDSQEVAYDYLLSNGQTVEIKTNKSVKPSSLWLDHVITARARSRIRSYLGDLSDLEAEDAGSAILQNAILERGFKEGALSDEQEATILHDLGLGSKEQLLMDIGRGKYPAQYVINRYLVNFRYTPDLLPDADESDEGEEVSNEMIKGAEGMKVSLGACCNPLPGEPIIGYLSMRHGLVMHATNCSNIEMFKKHPERWLPLEWSKEVRGDFPVQLYLLAKNRRGSIAAISAKITELNLDFEEFKSENINEDLVKIAFVIRVNDRKHLADVMRSLRLLDNVERVSRK